MIKRLFGLIPLMIFVITILQRWIGLMVMLGTWFLYASGPFPPAGGLILNLVGALMVLQGTYAILSSGYLSES